MVWRALWLLRQGITGSVWRARHLVVLAIGLGLLSGVAYAQEPQPDLPPPDRNQQGAPSEPRADVPAGTATTPSAADAPTVAEPRPAAQSPKPSREATQPRPTTKEETPKPAESGIPSSSERAPVRGDEDSGPARPPGERERQSSWGSTTTLESDATASHDIRPAPRQFDQLVPRSARAVEDGESQLVLAFTALGLATLAGLSTSFLLAVARRNRRDLEHAG